MSMKNRSIQSSSVGHTLDSGFQRMRESKAFGVSLAVSGAAMTLLFSYGGSLLFIGGGVLLSLVVCALAVFRFHAAGRFVPRFRLPRACAAAVLTVFILLLYGQKFALSTNELIASFIQGASLPGLAAFVRAALPALLAVMAFLALFFWLYWLIDRSFSFIAEWYRRSDWTERIFLLAGWVAAVAAIAAVYSSTTAFFGSSQPYDVVYTADSSQLVSSNAFFYLDAYENDIRQPLFGVFSMPFAAAALLVSKLLFFIPHSYPIVLGAVQAFLLLLGFTLLSRVLALHGAEKILFLCLLAFSYPTMLFLLTMEQYVFALFWVLLLVYAWHEEKRTREFPLIAAAGSLLTSGVLFPLLFQDRDVRKNLRRMTAAVFAFAAVFILFGRVPLLNSTIGKLREFSSFSGDSLPFGDRLLQYLNFASACLIRPDAGVDFQTFSHVSFQLNTVTSVNVPGTAVLIAAAAGAALAFRRKIVRLSACWAAFSFLILCVAGWGTSENGLVLYTLYFSWAFVVLLFELIRRLLSRWDAPRIACLAAAVVLLVLCNIDGMRELLGFAVQYYPVR